MKTQVDPMLSQSIKASICPTVDISDSGALHIIQGELQTAAATLATNIKVVEMLLRDLKVDGEPPNATSNLMEPTLLELETQLRRFEDMLARAESLSRLVRRQFIISQANLTVIDEQHAVLQNAQCTARQQRANRGAPAFGTRGQQPDV